MFEEKKERSRGPEPLSKDEYVEICREEDKKKLDSINIEPSIVDEFDGSSTTIILENDIKDNRDFDFETEEKPQELTPLQKSRVSRMIELKDDVEYQAILMDILHQYLQDRKLGILNFNYDVYKDGKLLKKIEDILYFDEKNMRSLEVNEEKLDRILKMFDVELADSDYEDVDTIGKAIQHLIGTRVILTQKTRGEYKNYKIVSVLDESEV